MGAGHQGPLDKQVQRAGGDQALIDRLMKKISPTGKIKVSREKKREAKRNMERGVFRTSEKGGRDVTLKQVKAKEKKAADTKAANEEIMRQGIEEDRSRGGACV